MATTLKEQKISVNLGAIVANAVTAVKAVRASEQSRRESEFQKAVAAGMSYAAQISFREKQLEDAKASDFSDPEYTRQLEGAIATTKKLARFETIRIKYKASLDDYVAGKESIASHIGILNDLLNGEQDPELKDEIRSQLSQATKEQSTIELNAIKNRALVAQKDTSQSVLDSSIAEIQSRRSLAAINQNDDEVAMWDDTLISLRSSKAKLQIENGLNEITFQTNQKNLKSNDKLGLINGLISKSDAASPVTYDGVTYPSLKAYWENKRGEYISNNYFADIKTELDAETAKIASTSLYGQVPVPRIDAVSNFYRDLAARPEFEPFKDKIEQQRTDAVSSLVTNLAESIYTEADSTGNIARAQTAITTLETKFGIKVSREAFASEPSTIATTATKDANALGKPTTPTGTPTTPGEVGGYTVKQGDTLSAIAARNNMTLHSLLDLNPTLKANPNAIKIGQNVTLAAPTTAPVSTPVNTPAPSTPVAPVQPQQPIKPVTTAPVQTPTPTPTPAPAPVKTPAPAPTPKVYVVKPGDTLSGIALSQLGDASKAFSLKSDTGQSFDATNAKKLQIGTKLLIP